MVLGWETSLSWDGEEETPLGWGGDLTELDGEETSLSWMGRRRPH